MTAISTTGTLTAGSSKTFNLAPGSALSLTLSPNVRVTITETPESVSGSGVGGNTTRVHEPQLAGTFAYGPYAMGGGVVVAVASNSGSSVAWTRKDTVVTTDSTGTSLVSWDGKSFGFTNQLRGGSLLRSGKPWLRQPAATTGLTAIGGVSLAAVIRNGRRAIEITCPADTSPNGFYFPISATVTAFQHATFEVEDASEWVGGTWRIGFFEGAAGVFTAGKQYVQTPGANNAWNGVHCLMPLTTEWATVGAGSFSNAMTQCAFRFTRKTSPTGTTRLWVYEIAEGEGNSLPSIILGADDGAKTWYTDGLPVLEKYGFSSYMAFIADDRGTATRMSQAEWADAITSRGHHAVVHGCKTGYASYRDYLASFAPYDSPQAAIEADIAYNRDIMVAEGLDPSGAGRQPLVLPGGYINMGASIVDDTIRDAMVNTGMTVARRAVVENGLVANGGWSGGSRYIPIIGHSYAGGSEATNISAIVTQMQAEIAAGRSVVLMFHEVRASPSANEHITAANLETIVAAAAVLVRSGAAKAGKLTDFAQELKTYTSPVHVGQ